MRINYQWFTSNFPCVQTARPLREGDWRYGYTRTK